MMTARNSDAMTLHNIALGLALAGAFAVNLAAQQSSGRTTTTSIDVNGRRVENAGYTSWKIAFIFLILVLSSDKLIFAVSFI